MADIVSPRRDGDGSVERPGRPRGTDRAPRAGRDDQAKKQHLRGDVRPMRFRVLSMTVPLRSVVVSARELGRRRRAERRRNRQRRADYAGERKEPVLRNVNVDALEVVRARTSDLDGGRRLPCTGILRWSRADRLTTPSTWSVPRSALPDTSPSTTKQRCGPGDKPNGSPPARTNRDPELAAVRAHPADSGVMARPVFRRCDGRTSPASSEWTRVQ